MRRLLALVPFRILFPVLFAAFTLVSVSIMIQIQTDNVKAMLVQDRKMLVAQNMSITRSYLEAGEQAEGSNDALRPFERDQEVQFLAILDSKDRIVQSLSPGLKNNSIAVGLERAPGLTELERELTVELIESWKASEKPELRSPLVEYRDEIQSIVVLYPYHEPNTPAESMGTIVQIHALGRLIEQRQYMVAGNVLTTNLLIAGVLALFALAYYIFLMRRLQNLLETTSAFGRGNLDLRANVEGRDEIAHLGRTFNMMADRIRNLAYRDSVTGIPNRLAFETSANRILRHAQTSAALLYLDLDGFKDINDSLGHSIGDSMLDEVATRLDQKVRELAGEEAILARIGGDEFAMLLPGRNDKRNIEQLCESFLQEISRDYHILGNVLHVTASIGLALYPEDGVNFEELLKNADAAMYSGKRTGKNTYIFFDQEIQQRNSRRVQLSAALRRALDRDEMQIHFQPILRLADGSVTHGEALLRWSNSEFGEVTPSEFIPILEESGYIRDVGQWVLKEACATAVRWRQRGFTDTGVSVNVAVQQLSQKDFARQVGSILKETGLPAERLILEITESELMRRPATTLRILEELNSMGVELAVDDFGTGYSSLNYLKYFPVHYLKLDGTFVRNMDQDPDNAAIARAVVELAHALKLRMIAEGVESRSIAEMLNQENCDYVQGFFTAAAVNEEVFLQFLSNQGPLFGP
ncbi:MAG: EAL domain-containing protein [Leptospiraceae bacterium]|nr:EAL domain-containing protein [Leptospiraceae bacterium]